MVVFPQKIIKNKDGSISVVADTTFYMDSHRNIIDFVEFQDSMNTGDYNVSLRDTLNGIISQLKKKDDVSEHPIFKVGNNLPDLDLKGIADVEKYKLFTLISLQTVII